MTLLEIEDVVPSVIGHRYVLQDQIGRGGMGTVYRAHDRLSSQVVALKRVLPPVPADTSDPTPLLGNLWSSPQYVAHRLAISREFRTLAALRHPYIISVLDYGFEGDGSPFFTMDYLGNAENIAVYGAKQPFAMQLNLLMQLLLAVTYLHRHGVLHRDLKPNNVLVMDGQVKVLDFGLSVSLREAVADMSGTPPYIAPEVLMGKDPTDASDLYAIGMIAYEIFAGRPLFQTGPEALKEQMTREDINCAHLNIDPRVTTVLEKLLSKRPENRRVNINELVASYTQITQRRLPYKEIVMRDSFLQGAPFIGRENEIARLSEALKLALESKGSTWLVAGVSGVGKSRLLGELHILAQVKNVLVLRGQAISESNLPYQIWQEPLRRLALSTELSDLEAGILNPILGDIEALIGRPVVNAPELDPPQANRERLLSTLASIFRRQTQPIMLTLEDIHWLNEESIDALKYLMERLTDMPILFVASFRQDEKPGLPKELPAAQQLSLRAFTSANIAELTSSMIGSPLKPGDRLIEFLERQTEGIPLFVVEVIRTLSEEVDQLQDIARMALPESISTYGIKTIIQRRLKQVSEGDYALLRAAAVAGRQLDLNVLKTLAPRTDQEKWLIRCSEAMVLDVQENTWRFSHDKVRESILDGLAPDDKPAVHRQIAQSIETVYPNDPAQVISLAYHWGQAQNENKEAEYALMAGEQSLNKAAYQQAILYLERALELAPRIHTPSARLTTLEFLLGQAHYACGHMVEGSAHLERTLFLLDWSKVSVWTLTRQVARQAWHRFSLGFIGYPLRMPDYQIQSLVFACRACETLGEIAYISNDKVPSLYYAMRGLNISERIGAAGTAEQARFYATVALGAGLVPAHGIAAFYLQQADNAIAELKDVDTIAWVLEATAVYHVGCARWTAAEERFRRCMTLAKEIGGFRRWLEGAAFLTLALHYRSDVAALEALHEELNAELKEHNDTQGMFWNFLSQGALHLLHDNRRQLNHYALLCEQRQNELDDRATGLRVQAFLCEAKVRTGDLKDAEKLAARILSDIDNQSPTAYPLLDVYITAARFFLVMWEKYGTTAYHNQARKACKLLNGFAKIFDIGRPASLTYSGWYNRLAGKPRQAADYARRGLEQAERLEMPYHEAEACYHMALQYPPTDALRNYYFERALTTFKRLGATYECDEIQKHFLTP